MIRLSSLWSLTISEFSLIGRNLRYRSQTSVKHATEFANKYITNHRKLAVDRGGVNVRWYLF